MITGVRIGPNDTQLETVRSEVGERLKQRGEERSGKEETEARMRKGQNREKRKERRK